MTEQEAIEAIKTINAATGYAFYPTDVGIELSVRPQSVQVQIIDGAVTCSVNADGRCLERIQEFITAKVPDVVFASVDVKPAIQELDDGNDSTT